MLATLGASSVEAKLIKLPEGKPKVLFDVPDDWTVTPGSEGLELRSPDKKVIIIAGLEKPTKGELSAWHKRATARMEALGVSFDPHASAKPKAAAPPAVVSPMPGSGAESTSVFSGAPSLETPEHAPDVTTATEDKAMSGLSLDQLTGKAPTPGGPHLRFRAVTLYGASYDGKPVDAQFLNFAVDRNAALLMQQESSSTDDRVGAVVDSIRLAP